MQIILTITTIALAVFYLAFVAYKKHYKKSKSCANCGLQKAYVESKKPK